MGRSVTALCVPDVQAVLQCACVVRARKSCGRLRLAPQGFRACLRFNRFGIGHRTSKQLSILVVHDQFLRLFQNRNIQYSEPAIGGQSASDANAPNPDMRILVSNDDGYLATGINVLASALESVADVVVVAPDRNRSAASNSLTLSSPLRVRKTGERRYRVNGTPSDCVHLALTGFLDHEPDLVVSGINHGANLGDDVIYSGTVAAAMEGRFLGYPTIAVSLVGRDLTYFDTAGRVAVELVQRLQRRSLPAEFILNVNVPDRPYDDLAGLVPTRLGFRHKSEPVVKSQDPHGRTIYWVGPAGQGQDAGPDTDFHAVEQGAVAITPLKVDLTRHEALADMRSWLLDD